VGVRVRDVFFRELNQLRYEPVDKRIRGTLGGRPVIDSKRAMLVWEPKRVVPSYAVPVEDIGAALTEASPADGTRVNGPAAIDAPRLGDRPVLDPSIPFSVHTAPGEPMTICDESGKREAAAFRPADPALSGYVVVDFDAFEAWYEEDERNVGHPRDPFHRIEIVHSSRQVRVEVDSTVIAESSRPYLLLEPPLPVRYYLPREDVRTELLIPSQTSNHLRIQRPRVVLVARDSRGHRLELSRAGARGSGDHRKIGVPQRICRSGCRRGAGRPAGHAVVTPLGSIECLSA